MPVAHRSRSWKEVSLTVTLKLDGICRMLLLKAYITGSLALTLAVAVAQTDTDQSHSHSLSHSQSKPAKSDQARQGKANRGEARRGEASPTETHNLEPASRAGIRVYSGCVNAFGSDAVRAFD